MTKEQEDNLRKLANYLMRFSKLKRPKSTFDMSKFSDGEAFAIARKETECGTFGCAVGHGPYAGVAKRKNENWNDYAERAFGAVMAEGVWRWLFSSLWCVTDNTPAGAAKRIRWYFEHGVPIDHRDQMNGYEPLCYT